MLTSFEGAGEGRGGEGRGVGNSVLGWETPGFHDLCIDLCGGHGYRVLGRGF